MLIIHNAKPRLSIWAYDVLPRKFSGQHSEVSVVFLKSVHYYMHLKRTAKT